MAALTCPHSDSDPTRESQVDIALSIALLYCPAPAAEPSDNGSEETPMPPTRRDMMFVFAASAALGGCATPGGQPAADWQQFGAADGTTIHYAAGCRPAHPRR